MIGFSQWLTLGGTWKLEHGYFGSNVPSKLKTCVLVIFEGAP